MENSKPCLIGDWFRTDDSLIRFDQIEGMQITDKDNAHVFTKSGKAYWLNPESVREVESLMVAATSERLNRAAELLPTR